MLTLYCKNEKKNFLWFNVQLRPLDLDLIGTKQDDTHLSRKDATLQPVADFNL